MQEPFVPSGGKDAAGRLGGLRVNKTAPRGFRNQTRGRARSRGCGWRARCGPRAPCSRCLPHPSPSSSPCQSLLGPQGAEKTLRNKFTYQEIPHELSPGAMRREVLATTHTEHRAGGSHAAPWQGERGKRGWERDEHQPQPRCFCPELGAGSFSTPCPRQPQGHGNYEAGPTAVNPSGKKQKKTKHIFPSAFWGAASPSVPRDAEKAKAKGFIRTREHRAAPKMMPPKPGWPQPSCCPPSPLRIYFGFRY